MKNGWAIRAGLRLIAAVLVAAAGQNVFAQATLTSVGHTTNSSSGGGAYATAVVISGKYAYLANGTDGLRIYDVSNPANPVNTGHVNDGGYAVGVAISGNYVLLGNGQDGLRIYDVSWPSNPVSVGHANDGGGSGYASHVAVSGNFAYLANATDGLRIYNISNKALPRNIGHVAANGDLSGPIGITLSGGRAYAACDQFGGLLICDISNPTNPVALGQIDTGGIASGVAVSWPYAFLANGHNFRAYDVSNPVSPLPLGQVETYPIAYDVAVSGNYAYLAIGSAGVQVFDVSNPTNLTLVAQTTTNYGGNADSLAVCADYLYVANESDGLRIFWLGPPAPPQLSARLKTTNLLVLSWPGPARSFAVQQSIVLEGASWLTLTNAPVMTNLENQVLIPASSGNHFYRLISN